VRTSVPDDVKNALEQLLGYESSMISGVKDRLRQTEHFNALTASWRLYSVKPEEPVASFICDVPASNWISFVRFVVVDASAQED
jgi:hypothetical protein